MLVVIGIGGSYLGARAVIEAVKGQMYNCTVKNGPQIFFVGNSISPAYFQDILDCCKGKRISLNIISKSGTTTEPALAFRVLRRMLEEQVGAEEAKKRIYATTDRARGTLKQLADAEGWETFVVPDDVGGRFSVLTAVGLLPIACAGCDIDALMAGAAAGMEKFSQCSPAIPQAFNPRKMPPVFPAVLLPAGCRHSRRSSADRGHTLWTARSNADSRPFS